MKFFSRQDKPLRIKLPFFDRIILYFAPIAIIILAITLHISISQYRIGQIENAENVLSEMTVNVASSFTNYVDIKLDVLESIANFDEIYNMDETVFGPFLVKQINEFGFIDLFIIDNDGNFYYPMIADVTDYVSLSTDAESDLKENAMEPDTYLSEPYYENEFPYMTLCTAIYNENDERVGTLCGKISLDDIEDIIERSEVLLDGICFMLDSGGHNISSAHHTDFFTYSSIYSDNKNSTEIISKAFQSKSDTSGLVRLLGTEYFAYVKYMDIFDWSIVMCINLNTLDDAINTMTYQHYIMLFLLVLLLFSILRIIYCWKKSDREINTDSLCGCGSRAACHTMIEYLEKNTTDNIHVLYADLNKFKYVNDTFGHDNGDVLLKIFSRTLEKVYKPYGFVGRVGGDEFVVFVTKQSTELMESLWQEVVAILDEESEKLDFDYHITSSHGIASKLAGEDVKVRHVVNTADNNMYLEKRGD